MPKFLQLLHEHTLVSHKQSHLTLQPRSLLTNTLKPHTPMFRPDKPIRQFLQISQNPILLNLHALMLVHGFLGDPFHFEFEFGGDLLGGVLGLVQDPAQGLVLLGGFLQAAVQVGGSLLGCFEDLFVLPRHVFQP
jgi:hypothetical protein